MAWAPGVPDALPADMREMARILVDTLESIARRLLELGVGYLGLHPANVEGLLGVVRDLLRDGYTVVDGNLVTGQNPGSAKATAQKVAALL